MSLFLALVILSFLVFFHELGHFLVAKLFKVRVHTFSIGFGKKLLSKQIGQTQYAISAIPLGGYVQMEGQDDLRPQKGSLAEDSYASKTPFERICILLAGPGANFLLAIVLYIFVGYLGVYKFAPQIGEVAKNSAAFHAGLKKGDDILAINEEKLLEWNQISSIVKNSKQNLKLTISRNGEIITKTLEPKIGQSKNIFGETVQRKLIGISPSGKKVKLHFRGFESLKFAFSQTWEASKFIFLSIEKLLIGVVPLKELGGVISIVKYTSDAASLGLGTLFIFVALISVNLGVLNLLPIPALDGGHIMFNIYEFFTNRPPNEKAFMYLTYLGWAFLLTLMAWSILNDILRLSGVY